MKTIIAVLLGSLLTGCAVYPYPPDVSYPVYSSVYVYPSPYAPRPPTTYICNHYGCYPQYK